MDFSEFNDEDFHAKDWINKILKTSESEINKEIFVQSLVTKLQNYMAQVNGNIEKTSNELLQSLPKIMHGTKLLQTEAIALKDKMTHVKEELALVEKNTGQSIKDIEYLDTMKNRLENAKRGLHEADNWVVLSNEIEDLLETNDIDVISNKIVSMQSSLKILINTSNYEDRKLYLEGLKNRLEAMSSPLLVKAFTSGNIDQSIKYVQIFKSIGRLPQLLKYYHKCQKGILLQKWRNQLEIDQDETLNYWMHNYYDFLLSHWHSQIKWCNQVFPINKVVITLIEIYTDLLLSIDPSFNECIDAALKQQIHKLDLLMQLKQISKQFADNLYVIIENVDSNKTCSEELLQALAKAIYSPYVIYIKNYGNFEQNYLNQQLNNLQCIKEELPETIQKLGMTIPEIFDLATAANKRCKQFTEGYGYCGLIGALKTFFTSYVDLLRIALRQIDRAKGIEEDWNMFQICVTLLQTSGGFLNNIQEFETNLIVNIQETSKISDNCFKKYKYLLLDTSGQKEHDSLLKSLLSEMTFMDSVNTAVQKLCNDIHHTTYQVIFAPITVHLELVKTAPAWSKNPPPTVLHADLPDYSFTPQEYITQIGQYLMTLPQHLEPFLLQDNSSLRVALKAADNEYSTSIAEEEGGLADVLLSIVARGTCQTYCDNIISIAELNGGANKQLATDIEYLGNILGDLGLSLSEQLQQLITLLRLPAEEYQNGSTKCSARLVAAVRQMRNITSSG